MLRIRASITWAGSALLALTILPSFGPTQIQAQSLNRPSSGRTATPLDGHMDWWLFDEYGWRAMSKGWYDTAQREFTSAVNIAKRPQMSDPRLLARSYSSLAWSLQKQGRNAEAEPLAKWALATRQEKFGPDSEQVARSLNQLATIYLEENRFTEAEPLLRRVGAMKASLTATMGQEQAQGASLLGLAFVAQRRYAEGEIEFARAVELRTASQGAKHPETGDELNNLAWARIEQGKLAEAKVAMDKAFDVLGQSRGQSDPSVARTLDGLARIDTEQNDLGAAEIKYRRLIAIYEQAGASQKGRLDDGLKRFAKLLDRMGRADEAAKVRARLGPPVRQASSATESVNFTSPRYPAPPAASPGSPARTRS